jgi:hypothetical protein
MLITRAVTVRGVPFLRLPDTMALLHLDVIRREPVGQQRLAQRAATDRQPCSVGNELPGKDGKDGFAADGQRQQDRAVLPLTVNAGFPELPATSCPHPICAALLLNGTR